MAKGDRQCEVYRHFDKDGRLLYVGIAWLTIARLSNHRVSSHWFDQITRVDIERFPSREAARAAELLAIKNEKPIFNIWTDTKRGIDCRSDAEKAEIAELLSKISASGYRARGNSCLNVLRAVWRSIEAGEQPDRRFLHSRSPLLVNSRQQ